ncbi:hypothetical protein BDP27DRAFT_1261671 [Rhodocollybia butyracea]|uniref:Uncharacterized protein n=1 Tax=Rhodocollybia butyracea TaxID=206335 RepID=A0A9P5PTV3_9AGAR|nr:hypothetical protein BDP27DRAFT_1261671 [Rhodocollybia butyracea]
MSSGVFYAYVHNIRNDDDWRVVITFASRAVSDEWWRAISGIGYNIKRITPQFYTHDPSRANVQNFFIDAPFKSIAEQFRGRMFTTGQKNRGGTGMDMIPPRSICDHISGNWFFIRSKGDQNLYWFHDPSSGHIRASHTERTHFQITANNMPLGTVMIGADPITVHIDGEHVVYVDDDSAHLVIAKQKYDFNFASLHSRVLVSTGGAMTYTNKVDTSNELWELV